jgi:hypothetical protein
MHKLQGTLSFFAVPQDFIPKLIALRRHVDESESVRMGNRSQARKSPIAVTGN